VALRAPADRRIGVFDRIVGLIADPRDPDLKTIIRLTRVGGFFNKPTRQRCTVAFMTLETAALKPSWESEMTSLTPRRLPGGHASVPAESHISQTRRMAISLSASAPPMEEA